MIAGADAEVVSGTGIENEGIGRVLREGGEAAGDVARPEWHPSLIGRQGRKTGTRLRGVPVLRLRSSLRTRSAGSETVTRTRFVRAFFIRTV